MCSKRGQAQVSAILPEGSQGLRKTHAISSEDMEGFAE